MVTVCIPGQFDLPVLCKAKQIVKLYSIIIKSYDKNVTIWLEYFF